MHDYTCHLRQRCIFLELTISPGIPGNPCFPGPPGGPDLPGGPLSPASPAGPLGP